jgi:N-acetyl-anhydromuramyl-L-alanine amidase AmpD
MAVPKPPITRDLITRNFTPASRDLGDIKWIVVHDMEMPEKPDTAEGCRDYFQNTGNESSSHYTIDNNSIVQCVLTGDIAWCALRTANRVGIHLEHAGFAKQTSGEWLDDYGKAMLDLSAWLVAWLCDQFAIPVKRLTVAEIKAGKPGIVGHGDLSAAGIDGNSHTDPGPGFPWAWYLDRINQHATLQEDDMFTDDDRALLKQTLNKADGTTLRNDLGWQNNYFAAKFDALTAAVVALAQSPDLDAAAIAAIVDKAVRDRLAKLAVVDNNQAGA